MKVISMISYKPLGAGEEFLPKRSKLSAVDRMTMAVSTKVAAQPYVLGDIEEILLAGSTKKIAGNTGL